MDLNYDLSGFSLLDEPAQSGLAPSSGGGLLGAWGDVKSVLSDGLSIAQDFYSVRNEYQSMSAEDHAPQFIPVPSSDMANIAAEDKAEATWFQGVSNTTVLIGGGMIVLGLLLAASRS